ncbi:hypothetical protein BD779DRAFT_1470696 [Infundibulicybe gibba]|nr:hypothetical protein BD779DRAFT_1470696 [Infundibulicybe gibba]
MAAMRLGRVGANRDTKLGDYAEFLLYGGGMDANALQGFGTCTVGSYRVCGGRGSRAMRCGGGRIFTGGGMTWGDHNESAGTLTNSYLQCERHGAMAILLELLGNYPSTELRVASADLRLMRGGAGAWKMKGDGCGGGGTRRLGLGDGGQ